MNEATKDLLRGMMIHRIIGHKHAPEELLLRKKTMRMDRKEAREFYSEYSALVANGFFWRMKKRTGRGTEWHVSINPEAIPRIHELIGQI